MHREIYMPCQTSQYYFWPEIPKCSVIYWMEKLLQYSCKQIKLCSYHIYFINKLKWNLKLKNNVCVVSLKPELFEGMRFDFTKGLNPKFSLSHRYVPCSIYIGIWVAMISFTVDYNNWLFHYPCASVFMGSAEIPSQSSDTIKVPTAHYEFGANFLDPKVAFLAVLLKLLRVKIWENCFDCPLYIVLAICNSSCKCKFSFIKWWVLK